MNPRNIRRWAEPGSIQHVYGHAVDKILLFHDDTDRARFLTYLEQTIANFDTKLLGFSLMDNHYHLILQLGSIPLERFMQKLLASYAMYYNRRHGHRGYVFNSRYFSILVGDAWYEMVLQRYVIRNRLVAGLEKSLKDLIKDPWTSLGALLGFREVRYLSVEIALKVFGKDVASARASLIEFLEIPPGGDDPYVALLSAAEAQRDPMIIGTEEFVTEQRRRFQEANPEAETPPPPMELDVVIREICMRRGITQEDLTLGRRSHDIVEARSEIVQVAFRELRLTFAAIGRQLGLSRSAVQKAFDRRGPR